MAPGPPDESDFLYEPSEDDLARRSSGRPIIVAVAILSVVALVLASVGTLLWVGAGGSGNAGDRSTPVVEADVVGQKLPDLNFETFDGARRSLAEVSGPLVINFFAYWCTPCREEMPDFQRAHELYGDEVGFLGLDYVDAPDNGLRMISETGVTYAVGRDPTGSVLAGLGGVAMPTTVFVDRGGVVTSVRSGRLDAASLQQIIAQELGVQAEARL